MKKISLSILLLVSFVVVQTSAQRQRFLDRGPFAKPRRQGSPGGGPPPRLGGPGGGPPPHQGNPRVHARPQRIQNIVPGPGPIPQALPGTSGTGQLPLNPRPEFNGPPVFRDHEEDFEEGFTPIHLGNENEEDEIDNQRLDLDHESHSEERSSPEPLQSPTPFPEQYQSAEPQHSFNEQPTPSRQEEPSNSRNRPFSEQGRPFRGPQKLEQQETQEIEFLSALPPTNIRKRNTARPHRPAHPNEIPVYHEVYNQNGELVGEGEEEEEEEPDRLAILLLNSKFTCGDKNNGYYADEDVHCEVFHYCQDNVKHSWLCPEGASFHQVHLICMPVSEDNICERSSTFHFVNDFLYKELEGPNKTYAQRYYPEGFADGVANAGAKQQSLPISDEVYQAPSQPDRFPVSQKTRRPTPAFQNQSPPTYHPSSDTIQASQSYKPEHLVTETVQHQPAPEFQQPQHFSQPIAHPGPSFQPQHNFGGGGQDQFAAFHSPEEVQRPHTRPHLRPGRRPGNFNRHPPQLG